MTQTQINIKLDESLKIDSENILNELGFNITEAVRIFLKKVVRDRGIPFGLKLDNDFIPNKKTEEAMFYDKRIEVNSINDLWTQYETN